MPTAEGLLLWTLHHFSPAASHAPVQQFVRTADLDKVYAAANQVLAKGKAGGWNLKAFTYYYIPVPPNGIAGIVVEAHRRFCSASNRDCWTRFCAIHGEDRDRCCVREAPPRGATSSKD